ncbi:hypothetical protein MYP_1162 [Sporocytophaga myxococcoides]|uniref:Uncharacterized protein n=1 Tax=Sporocytophaga myxococcoides TaxID=153721 RepID=A0A098LBY3_9BACT|nr:hypothetical protein [Sporocytophaga myxococcoides]GAL83934.1 hypothetical protein MYP_1162 [Sporocytophaga myxococcoides]
MKTYNLLLTSLFLLFSNCQKEGATFNKFTIFNNSGVDVKIISKFLQEDTLVLLKGDIKDFNLSWGRGLSDGVSYAPFVDGNPITVIFNKSVSITHYNDTLSHPSKSYNLFSERCFYNKASYHKEIVNNSKHLRTVTLSYTFIQQDYLDAKNQ